MCGDARADALETLERVGYLNEARFAATRAETLADRGHGDASIRHALEGEGIPGDAVEAALAQLVPEQERALRAAETVGDGVAERRRFAARLHRLGFAEDSLAAALGVFAEEERGP